ncbi:RND transporter MFP subunit [Clostridium beijerinckii]|uniref:Efflux RND transporter periplasmic adaptor subunit n=2 Tax=Clostridium beijerinckii TaxID=1520 RepID=A0AB74VA23_CLOBE|nr:efflux RND transporter periplasmic adaptor subunit [Clostridium beijerinckii]MBC2459421.1 efflux RND transporter periplasmic adaptor subunit [Clostridium beijerinckii]MBC2476934.1 efflux RND transporter periplasmic adaptor subunit [Clostridium beijerinckii]OOM20239.1 toluene efflux pump periplasmic linker protein TtgD precursor [Clostridium beijerinckii]QUN33234.1 efflux RND transporter periplasmic adaptor subunit [Clostridium beijerinckii]SQB19874.1 RND family efflux transporter MFP subuni
MKIKMIKKFLLVIGIVAICFFVFKVVKTNSKKEETVLPPPVVKTLTISTSNKDSEYVYSGVVQPHYKSQLAFQVGGKIIKKNVSVGDKVEQGAVLMEVDSRDIEQAVKNSEAAVSLAEAKYKLAEDNLKRYEPLYQSKFISQAEYDNYVNADETAKDALEQANALHTQSLNQLDYCKLCADKSGVISGIDAEEGQVVTPGQKIITLVQNNQLEVEINVPENRIDQLKSAKEINISFSALSDVKLKGSLGEISPVANDASRTYRVRINLIDPPPNIKIGMSSSVSINENNSSSQIWMPLGAVYQPDSSPAVWVVKDNAVTLKNITVKDFGSDQVTVSDGLSEGDVVVTAGITKLREGQDVRVGSDN